VAVFKFRNLKTGQATPIPPGEFTVGRADDTYIHLDDSSVSRRHARLHNIAEGFFVEDIGSANGTAVRGAKIEHPVRVELGEIIYVGTVAFRLDPEVDGEDSAAPMQGLRSQNKARLSRDTERLPLPGEAPREVPVIAPENLAAPVVAATDADSEELNAVQIREPEAFASSTPQPRTAHVPLPETTTYPPEEPTEAWPEPKPARAVGSPHTVSKILIPRSSLPAAIMPMPQTLPVAPAAPKPATALTPPKPAATPTMQPPHPVQAASAPSPAAAAAPAPPFTYWLVVFLAGLGTGLLLGLVFARMFIDLGGSAHALP